MKLAKISTLVVVFSMMAAMALAQPPGGGQGRGGRGRGMGMGGESPLKALTDAIGKLNLTDEQKQKIADLKKEYEPKFKELADKAGKIPTDEQKKTMEEARKVIRDQSASQEDRQAAFQKLRDIKWTDDQQKERQEVGQQMRSLMQEARPKFRDVLTDDQKKELDKAMPQRGRGRGGRGGGNQPQST